MATYFFDKDQKIIKIVSDDATIESNQTQELNDSGLLIDTLAVKVFGDEKLLDAEYMAVRSYTGNAQTLDMYRILTDTTPDQTMSFTGMQIGPYELDGHIIQDMRPTDQEVSFVMNNVLTGTDWRLGYIETALPKITTNFYYLSVKQVLKNIQELANVEMIFKVEISGSEITDKWIEVYRELGDRTLKRFNYGTNALTVVRETNKADIYTALIGRGKGEEVSSAEENESGQAGYGRKITFDEIEWQKSAGNPLDKPLGQYHLEMPESTALYGIKTIGGGMLPRIGIVEFEDITDPLELIKATHEQLKISSRPLVLFKATVANIGKVGIGDTVTIHRHDLNIHYEIRVRKVVRNKLNDNKTQVELGDAVVSPSTKRQVTIDTTIKGIEKGLEDIATEVNYIVADASGSNAINFGNNEPERKRVGDLWYRDHPSLAGEKQVLIWNGTIWEIIIDTSDTDKVERYIDDVIQPKIDELSQQIADADIAAKDALEKAGVSTNLAQTAQETADSALASLQTTRSDIEAYKHSNDQTVRDVEQQASDAFAKAQANEGKFVTVEQSIDNINGELSQKIESADLTGELNTFKTNILTETDSKISQSLVDYVTEDDLSDLQIGGRNFILNSDFASDLVIGNSIKDGWSFNGTEYTQIDNDRLSVTFTTAGNSATSRFVIWIAPGKMDIAKGDFVTLSFKGKADAPNVLNIRGGGLLYTGTTSVTINEAEQVYSLTLQSNSATEQGAIVGYLETPGVIEFDWIQLERGSVNTSYSPAPEDFATQSDYHLLRNEYTQTAEEVERIMQDFAQKTDLNGLVTTTQLTSLNYVSASQIEQTLTSYVTSTDIEGLATKEYARTQATTEAGKVSTELTNYAKKTDLDNLDYATESWTNNRIASTSESTRQEILRVETKVNNIETGDNTNMLADTQEDVILDGTTHYYDIPGYIYPSIHKLTVAYKTTQPVTMTAVIVDSSDAPISNNYSRDVPGTNSVQAWLNFDIEVTADARNARLKVTSDTVVTATATVTIKTEPLATVTIEGVTKTANSSGSVTFTGVPIETVPVVLSKSGFTTRNASINVVNNGTYNLPLTAIEEEPSNYTIKINTTPNAQVMLTAPFSTSVKASSSGVANITAFPHELNQQFKALVYKDGYQDRNITFTPTKSNLNFNYPLTPVSTGGSNGVRYLRFHNLYTTGTTGLFAEIEAWAGNTNLLLGKQFTIPAGTTATNMTFPTDGNRNYVATTFTWGANGYVQFDLGSVRTDLTRINVLNYAGQRFSNAWTDVSADGVTWRRIYDRPEVATMTLDGIDITNIY